VDGCDIVAKVDMSFKNASSIIGAGLVLALYMACMMAGFSIDWFEPNSCEMSYSRPSYDEIPVSADAATSADHSFGHPHYRLFRYQEMGIRDVKRFTRQPVLFIHGNKGSYKQVAARAHFAGVVMTRC